MALVNFRTASIDDLPILYQFEQGIIEAERPFDPTLKPGHINYYDLKLLIESDDAEVIVAVIDNEIIASAYTKIKKANLYENLERYGYLGFIFVKPEHRGKGISSKVIGQLRNWAKSKDLNELRLEVYNDNISAVKAYEKFGFKKHLVKMRVEI